MLSSGFQKGHEYQRHAQNKTSGEMMWTTDTTMEQDKISHSAKHHHKGAYMRVHLQQRQVQNSRLQPYNKRVCKIAYLYL
jgi:hypothetical protein